MSGGTVCKCPKAERQWVVTCRRHNHSAFNGWRWTPSDYSEVRCETCRERWRTTAAYVDNLKTSDKGCQG